MATVVIDRNLLRHARNLLARFSRMGEHSKDAIASDIAVNKDFDVQAARYISGEIQELLDEQHD